MAHQYPANTGPVNTNTAAPFSEEMVLGSHPDTNRAFKPPQRGHQISETTPVLTSSPEMFSGWVHPDRPRLFLAPKIPLPDSQPTPVATSSPDMYAGNHPDQNRAFIYPKLGLQIVETTPVITFSPEMAGIQPTQPRLPVLHIAGLQLWLPEVTFTVEMTQGSHPDSPRLFLAPRIPLPFTQETPITTFSIEMVSTQPPQGRLPRLDHTGHVWWTAEVPPFDPAMVQGSHPDQPRLFMPLRVGVVMSTSIVVAPVVIIAYEQIAHLTVMIEPVVLLTVEI
jgi:hypothetical protein